jgi:hypothetical protein
MLWAIYGVDRTGTADLETCRFGDLQTWRLTDLATCTCGLAATTSINLRQRARGSKQGLPLRPYPRGHVPTFGAAAGAGRDMGMQ